MNGINGINERADCLLKSLFTTRRLTIAALTAALYAALTLALAPISFVLLQMRVSEALTLLPILFPEAIPGLFIGCLISNLLSPLGLPDIIFGSLATLAAALLTWKLRRVGWAACIPPIAVNAVVIGLLLHYQANAPLLPSMLLLAAEQAVPILILGNLIIFALRKVMPKFI